MSQGKFRSFLTGALVGAGLGILLAPKEGSETRNDLKKSFSLLIDTIKNIDLDESKANLLNKVKDIKEELASIDDLTVKDVAVEKIKIITDKCDELINEAKEIDAPVVILATEKVRDGAISLLNSFLMEIEENKKTSKSVKQNSSLKKTNVKIKKNGNSKSKPTKKEK